MAAEAQFSEAIEAFRQGELDRALNLAEQRSSGAPPAEWHHLVGLIYCRQGNLERGVEHLRLAVEAEPANLGFKVMLARALIDSGNPAEVLGMEKPARCASPAGAFAVARPGGGSKRGRKQRGCCRGLVDYCVELKDGSRRMDEPRPEPVCTEAVRGSGRSMPQSACPVAPRRHALLTLGLIYERTNRLDELDSLLDQALEAGVGREQLSFLGRCASNGRAACRVPANFCCSPIHWTIRFDGIGCGSRSPTPKATWRRHSPP